MLCCDYVVLIENIIMVIVIVIFKLVLVLRNFYYLFDRVYFIVYFKNVNGILLLFYLFGLRKRIYLFNF